MTAYFTLPRRTSIPTTPRDVPVRSLHDLGWHAFQQFCHTVLREILGQQVVSFLDGGDAGRDGAFAGVWNDDGHVRSGQFVVQCKHTAKPGVNLTLSAIQQELHKVERLVAEQRCDVYVLMTNAGVTGRSEEAIVRELKQRGVRDSLILGSTWLNQTVAESSRLRRLVPRLYGLGDLTQILDERAYRQSRAVLDAMRPDLDKLVLTSTYQKAANALGEHGFVLLVGAPATGKTTIAAQLALGCADEFDTAVVKIDTIERIEDRWNPDERQLFWLDDAFGSTQYDRSLAWAWTSRASRVASAIKAGSMIVVTSRDYIYRAAYSDLKPGSFPLLEEAQVVVNVADLTVGEREQILYNHLRHGRHSSSYLRQLRPHLDESARHKGFTPELARRLADPTFTGSLVPDDPSSVGNFFSHPKRFLADVMHGLDRHARAALGLIYINHDWLPSPVSPSSTEEDLIARLGSDLGGVIQALNALDGSLARNVVKEGESEWVFAHPTMVDAYADLLRTPDLLRHLIAGFPVDVLFSEITCGNVGVRGAIVVPKSSYDAVLDRLDEPLTGPWSDWWRQRDLRTRFLTTRCDVDFLEAYAARRPKLLEEWEPGLMLEADADNELAARFNELGLFPEATRTRFAAELMKYCLSGEDPAVLHNERLRSILTGEEWTTLLKRVREEMVAAPETFLDGCVQHWTRGDDIDSTIDPLRQMLYELPSLFPDDETVAQRAEDLEAMVDQWQSDHAPDDNDDDDCRPRTSATDPGPTVTHAADTRSVFDDLVRGRSW